MEDELIGTDQLTAKRCGCKQWDRLAALGVSTATELSCSDLAHLVDQNVEGRQTEKHFCLCLICSESGKAFADDAVPIRSIFAVKVVLDVLRDILFVLVLLHGSSSLLLACLQQLAAVLVVD